jgi:hypothetical protein
MDNKIYRQADFILKNYKGSRSYCHKIGMIVDAHYTEGWDNARARGYNNDYVSLLGDYKGQLVWNRSTICTAGLKRNRIANAYSNMQAIVSPSQYDYHGSGFDYKCDLTEQEIIRYYDIMLNHTPYSKVYMNRDASYAYNHGIIIDCDYSRNLVIGALMAQRIAWENTKIARRILHYVDLGVNKTVAFMLGFTFDRDGGECKCDWHVPMDGGRLRLETLRNFVHGDYVKEPTMRSTLHYDMTIHETWGGTWGITLQLLNTLEELYRGKGNTIPNPFALTLKMVIPSYNDKDIADYFTSESVTNYLGVN